MSAFDDSWNTDDPPIENGGPETRTTASEGRSCFRCGGPIKGRRTNGFCSTRCRMRVRREQEALRRQELVSRLKDVVAAVEAELVGVGTGEDDGRR
jgi:hypothetical protein